MKYIEKQYSELNQSRLYKLSDVCSFESKPVSRRPIFDLPIVSTGNGQPISVRVNVVLENKEKMIDC